MDEPGIFTKIINGDIPCHKIYEDDKTFAFLDIHPIQPGQVLVVPKTEVPFAWDLDDATYQSLMATAKKIALRLREQFPDKTHVGMHVEGLDVAHAHLKIFPFSTHQEFTNHPDMSAEPDHAALAEMAKKLAF
jgi:histidine triad (HIT) family protein